ncbi:hypothetical protein CYMTET_27843 [Cymbomonas tetramitiformis]|uniref:Right handed beta helix domain-containing protein n=1 Tax=Cymbomonas tetramitiformis TaxID=36881 RepID=A0AAE0FQK1_9CHLO|nr:hypothetical protein CYMTET_27843 [Cymbomonas tetramitiformis]
MSGKWSGEQGAGVLVQNCAEVTAENAVFAEHTESAMVLSSGALARVRSLIVPLKDIVAILAAQELLSSPVVISDSRFEVNVAVDGAAVHASGDFSFSGCSFESNVATRNGPLYLRLAGQVRVEACKMTNNSCSENGGAMYIAEQGGSGFDNSSCFANSTHGHRLATTAPAASSLITLSLLHYEGNHAGSGGAAAFWEMSDPFGNVSAMPQCNGCSYVGNSARYSSENPETEGWASPPVRLEVPLHPHEEAAGVQLQSPISAALVDMFGQVVLSENAATVRLLAEECPMRGLSQSFVTEGQAEFNVTFSNMPPGSICDVDVSAQLKAGELHNSTRVHLRACRPGRGSAMAHQTESGKEDEDQGDYVTFMDTLKNLGESAVAKRIARGMSTMLGYFQVIGQMSTIYSPDTMPDIMMEFSSAVSLIGFDLNAVFNFHCFLHYYGSSSTQKSTFWIKIKQAMALPWTILLGVGAFYVILCASLSMTKIDHKYQKVRLKPS